MTDGVAGYAASGVSESGGGSDTRPSPPREPAAIWAEALQALAAAVAHDLRNALNAVAVNLEVVRGRSARGTEAFAIAPFATVAVTNFENAAGAVEALLAFARPEPTSVDLAVIVTRVSRLFGVAANRKIELTDRTEGRARTSAPPDIVRAAVARSVLTAFVNNDAIACEITGGDGIFLSLTGPTRIPPLLDSELVAAAGAHGISFASRVQSLELRFPAVD